MHSVHYYTNIAPHYRKKLWELFLTDKELDIHIFFGKTSGKDSIHQIDFSSGAFIKNKSRLHTIKNYRIFNVLIYQSGVIKHSLFYRPDIVLFLGQAYIISTWIACIIYKMKGVRIIFWGHGLYGRESKIKKWFSLFFAKVSDHYLVYNNRSKQLMIDEGYNAERIHVIYNSLDYDLSKDLRNEIVTIQRKEQLPFFPNPDRRLLVFIGRLTEAKKLDLLVNAVYVLNKDNIKYNLLIIGEGGHRKCLEKLAHSGLEAGFIHFLGELYDEKEIAKFLSVADLCVSPGNVGLTAIHALSYGTPVCTHNNLAHQMPEYEAIEEGKTGFFFNENDFRDLSKQINVWFERNTDKEIVRKNCFRVIDDAYNPYFQVELLKKIIT